MKRVLDAIHEKLRKTRPSGQDGKDTFLASLRRIAKVVSQDHDLYGTSLIVGYGMGMGRGQGFDTVNPEDLEDHIDRVTRLEVDNSVLAEVNEILSARVVELEKRLEVDHLFAGEDMVREDVPPEERLSIPDGVTARDAAIELQKGFIDKQEARISDLETALENAKYKISQLEMDHAELAGIDAKCTALCVENAQLRYRPTVEQIRAFKPWRAYDEPEEPAKADMNRDLLTLIMGIVAALASTGMRSDLEPEARRAVEEIHAVLVANKEDFFANIFEIIKKCE